MYINPYNWRRMIMPVFKNYSEDGQLLNEVTEPLGQNNLERYLREHGEEKTKLYLEILAEVTTEISYVLYPYLKEENLYVRGGLHKVQKNLNILFEHNKSVLKLGETILASGNPKPDDPKAETNIPG
jgi:hypothetical protein